MGPPIISVSYRVLYQKPQPTSQPTPHCTIELLTPSAVRYSPCAASVSSRSSCVYRSSVVLNLAVTQDSLNGFRLDLRFVHQPVANAGDCEDSSRYPCYGPSEANGVNAPSVGESVESLAFRSAPARRLSKPEARKPRRLLVECQSVRAARSSAEG